jgi:hypothetical protein
MLILILVCSSKIQFSKKAQRIEKGPPLFSFKDQDLGKRGLLGLLCGRLLTIAKPSDVLFLLEEF